MTSRPTTPVHFPWICGILCLLLLESAGCTSENSESLAIKENLVQNTQTPHSLQDEVCEISYLQGDVLGEMRTTEHLTAEGLRTAAKAELRIRRQGETLVQQLEYDTLCTPEGEVIRASSRLPGGVETEVIVSDGTARWTDVRGGTQMLACPTGTGGFFALQQNLRRNPMRPNEIRSFQSLEFGENSLTTTTLHATDYEITDFPAELSDSEDGESACNKQYKQKLLRIERTANGGTIPQKGTLWTDERGEIWKQTTELLGIAVYRTDATTLQRLAERMADFDHLITVPIQDATSDQVFSKCDLQNIAQLQCEITIDDDTNFANFFPDGPLQHVIPQDSRTASVILTCEKSQNATDGELEKDGNHGENRNIEPNIESKAVVAEDLSANAWIESDAPELVAAAQSILPNETNPRTLAVALEQEAKQRIPKPNYHSGFESALTALRRGEGDCTEHAVLLAGLARSRGIPARIATGLILESNAAAFHAWTELYLVDRWVAFDATRPQGGISARYLRAVVDNLAGVNAVARLQRLLPIVGKIHITVRKMTPISTDTP